MPRHRDRKSADGLLPLMEARPWADGKTVTYRYHPIGKRPINLGTDKVAALRKVLDMLGQTDNYGTVAWVWDKYQESRRWLKLTDGSKDDYRGAWKQLEKTFGRMQLSRITPPIVAKYVNQERASALRRAAIEKALLSNLCRHGITLGVCSVNPTVGVEMPESEPRTEAPAEGLLRRFLNWLSKQAPQKRIAGLAAEYMCLSGSRKVEFLDITWPQVDREAGVIRTPRAKQRGKKRGQVWEVILITPRMADLLDRIETNNKDRDCPYLFPTEDNNAYTARGFKTNWQRVMGKALEEGVLTRDERFTFHDLRAFFASKYKSETGKLPDLHKDPGTTARVYDRNKEVRRSAL